MLPRPQPIRIAVLLSALMLPAAACGKDAIPTSTYSDAYTGSTVPKETHLRGRVIDLATNAPIGGAVVEIMGVKSTSQVDGSYNAQHLRVGAADLMTTRTGYDTARTLLALVGGDQEFTVRMRATVVPASIR